jgi:hypothetical protein
MDYHVEAFYLDRLWLPLGKQMNVFSIFQPGSKPVLSIVISKNQIDFDPGILQTAHTVHKIKTCAVVAPLAIEEVTGDDDERAFLIYRERNEVIEGTARGVIDATGEILGLSRKTYQWTVNMQIGGMEKAEARHHLIQDLFLGIMGVDPITGSLA